MKYYQEKEGTEFNIPAQIYISNSQGGNCHYPLHWHNNLEFNLVLDGTITGQLNGKQVVISSGDIFFVNSRELHETDAVDRNKMRSITILLSYNLLKEYCADIDMYYFDFSEKEMEKEQIKELILQCADIYQKKEIYYELDLAIILRMICSVLLKDCKKKRQDDMANKQELESFTDIRTAILFLEHNYQNSISLQQVANEIGMTPNYLSRFFKKATGETVYGYLTNVRLYYAYKELMNSNHTVTEIALNNGFPNVKSFIETFKKEYQSTPVKYKDQLRKR